MMPDPVPHHQFQSTLPRGERQVPIDKKSVTDSGAWIETLENIEGILGEEGRSPRVSIHAPAGGATLLNRLTFFHSWVSIHAPAGGATFLT